MKLPVSCAALSLALVVAACGASTTTVTPPITDLCPAKVQGQMKGTQDTIGTPWSAPHVNGKLLIVGTAGLSSQSLKPLQGLNVTSVTPALRQVRTPAGKTDAAFARELAQAGLNVQPDFLYQPLATTNDPGFPGNVGINVNGQTMTQTYLTRIRLPGAWDVMSAAGLPLSGALTAVVDSAVDTTHPELLGRVTASVSQVDTLTSCNMHVYEHGTAAAGIIGATGNNSAGITGTGQRQPLLLEEVITSDGASTSSVTAALYDAVKRGAKVINISLGIPDNPDDQALDQALTTAANSAVLVAAAGNTSVDVYYPASHPSVIAVGAVGNSDDALAWYSARPSSPGKRVLDIVAPGGDVGAPLLTLAPQNTYAGMSGTSFAAPQVSGVAALMRAANPRLSAAQTRALLLGQVNSASGLPLLDAAAAVRAALAAN